MSTLHYIARPLIHELPAPGDTSWPSRIVEPRPATALPVILLATDDAVSRRNLTHLLQRAGYGVAPVSGVEESWRVQRQLRPDLVIVGSRLAAEILHDAEPSRPELSNVPMIVLVDDWRRAEQLTSLTNTVDYIAVPVVATELLARVAISLRRSSFQAPLSPIACGHVRIDVEGRAVSISGRHVMLTALQFDLLHYLAINPNRPLSRDHLLRAVWGLMNESGPAAVTVQVRRLREHIEPDPSSPRCLRTVWGVGYRFDCHPPVDDVRIA